MHLIYNQQHTYIKDLNYCSDQLASLKKYKISKLGIIDKYLILFNSKIYYSKKCFYFFIGKSDKIIFIILNCFKFIHIMVHN